MIKPEQIKPEQIPIEQVVQQWVNGGKTLKELAQFTDDELYVIATYGYNFLLQGKYELAKTLFLGLISIDSKNEYYHRVLALIWYNLGDFEKALQAVQTAMQMKAQNLTALLIRSEIYIAASRYTEAKTDIKVAIKLAQKSKNDVLLEKANMLESQLKNINKLAKRK